MKQLFKDIRFYAILILALILLAAYYINIDALNYKADVITNITSLLGYLLIISLFVERSIEVFLSAMRSEQADILDRKTNRLIEKIESTKPNPAPKDIDELEEVKDERTKYRARSRFISIWIGLVIGVIIAVVGVRVLGQILEVDNLTGIQKGFFIIVDVLITGSILAGGSEAINKIMKVYNNFMNKAADK